MTEYFSLKEAMKYLGVKSHKTLNYYIKLGLPVVTIGKSKRISKTAIDDFMTAHTLTNGGNEQWKLTKLLHPLTQRNN